MKRSPTSARAGWAWKAEWSCRWARCATFEARRPVACLCQLTRPDVDEHFIGRADF
jgi:hypothetical protein